MVEHLLMMRWVVGSIPHGYDGSVSIHSDSIPTNSDSASKLAIKKIVLIKYGPDLFHHLLHILTL